MRRCSVLRYVFVYLYAAVVAPSMFTIFLIVASPLRLARARLGPLHAKVVGWYRSRARQVDPVRATCISWVLVPSPAGEISLSVSVFHFMILGRIASTGSGHSGLSTRENSSECYCRFVNSVTGRCCWIAYTYAACFVAYI